MRQMTVDELATAVAQQAEAEARAEADADDMPDHNLCVPESIYRALRPASPGALVPVQLVRATWIRQRAAEMRAATEAGDSAALRALIICRRQEMPEDAFISADELQAIPAPRGRVAVGAVSYCWETRAHPDPLGHMLMAVGAALDYCAKLKGQTYGRAHHSGDAYTEFPEEMGVFIDFCSLFQHPADGRRTPEEDRMFKQALGELELWYAHSCTTVFLLTESGEPGEKSYFERGWPTYESMVCRLQKFEDSHLLWGATRELDRSGRLK